MTALYVLACLAVLFVVALLVLGRTGANITSSRFGRVARISRLIARLSTSRLGAKLRLLITSKEKRAAYSEERRQADAAAVVKTMGQMKGVFMKVGQMMSFVSDAIPVEYRTALRSLQASAPPMDFALLRDVAERELGKPLERVFASFDPKPLAAASIGQVHRATLPSGEEVVVKIQYPGVAEAISADLKNVGVLYRMVGMMYPGLDPKPVVEELRARFTEELDYRREARNQMAFYDLYEDHPFIRIPRVHEAYSTGRVLTSEFVSGRTFEDIAKLGKKERDHYGEILYRFVFGSLFRFAVFNGDPHPGNYIFTDDGQVAFIDFGCIKYFPEAMFDDWMQLVQAHLDGHVDDFRRRAVKLGFFVDHAPIAADVLYEYFGFYYEPFHEDREFAFTREYNNESLTRTFKPEGKFEVMTRHANIPPDLVFANRLQWGVYSLLAQLGATANWHAIHLEFMDGAPARTELGKRDEAHRVDWMRARGLDSERKFLLRPKVCANEVWANTLRQLVSVPRRRRGHANMACRSLRHRHLRAKDALKWETVACKVAERVEGV